MAWLPVLPFLQAMHRRNNASLLFVGSVIGEPSRARGSALSARNSLQIHASPNSSTSVAGDLAFRVQRLEPVGAEVVDHVPDAVRVGK